MPAVILQELFRGLILSTSAQLLMSEKYYQLSILSIFVFFHCLFLKDNKNTSIKVIDYICNQVVCYCNI